MKKLSGLIAIVVLLGMSVTATAETKAAPAPAPATKSAPATGSRLISTWGGAIVPLNTRMLDISTGFPSAIFVRYHIPILRKLELAPFFTFDYGFDTGIAVGDTFGLQIKFSLYDSPKIKLALVADFGLQMWYWPGGFQFAIQLGFPEVLLTIPIGQKFAIDAGLKMPIAFMAYPGFLARIPILFNVGVEYKLMSKLNLFFNMDMGPDIIAFAGGATVLFRPDVKFGVSMRF